MPLLEINNHNKNSVSIHFNNQNTSKERRKESNTKFAPASNNKQSIIVFNPQKNNKYPKLVQS
jgi:hypothetical protein